MNTLLLDTELWDLAVDAVGNIAMASDPYSMAQDAASNIRTFEGEVYYNTTLGVPYWEQVLGQAPPISLMKALWNAAGLEVPGVVGARTFITEWVDRTVRGQVQVTDSAGVVSAAGFTTSESSA